MNPTLLTADIVMSTHAQSLDALKPPAFSGEVSTRAYPLARGRTPQSI